jgi:hypothetical protein
VRRVLIGPFLVGALLARPVRSGADEPLELSGTGEVIASYLNLSDFSSSVLQPEEAKNLWTMGGRGALDAALGSLHLEAEFSGEGTVHNADQDDTYLGSFGGALHAGWRNPEVGSLGAFGGAGNLKINDFDGKDRRTIAYAVGGEGQLYFDPVTLYAQVGYLDRETAKHGGDKNVLKNAPFFRLVGRFFPCDDVEFNLQAAFAHGKMDPDEDNLFLGDWAAGVEARIPGIPLSGFLQYTGAYYFQDDDSDKLLESRIGFGLRFYFEERSLKANDRRGVSLDMPRYLQWGGITGGPLE